jgi:hypothetical protein
MLEIAVAESPCLIALSSIAVINLSRFFKFGFCGGLVGVVGIESVDVERVMGVEGAIGGTSTGLWVFTTVPGTGTISVLSFARV